MNERILRQRGCRSRWPLPAARWLTAPLLLGASLAQAQIWRHVDAEGVLYFSNEKQYADSEQIWLAGSARSKGVVARELGEFTPQAADRAASAIERSPGYYAVKDELAVASTSYSVDLNLLKAVVAAESAFDHKAVSPKGAVGLMQIMPATARRYGVAAAEGTPRRLLDPVVNIHTGTRYLSDLLRMFDGRTELAVAAYNAGEGAVRQAGNRVPGFDETQRYVSKVMAIYGVLQRRAERAG